MTLYTRSVPISTQLTPARKRLGLLSLALGGFAIGTTEFVALGLLPNLAADLLPTQYAAHPAQGLAHAGWLVSAYALGVVVGAPTIAATTAKLPHKRLLVVLLAWLTLATLASAVLPSFGFVLAARFFAGLPHGAYFGIASIVAADIMGPGNRGKGVSMVLGGLTIANVVGVPAMTFIGQHAGWRVSYLVVAALFAATFAAVLLLVPAQRADDTASVAREFRAFRSGQLWIVMAIGAIGFGGFFAVYSYISPVVTHVTGLPAALVPWTLVTLGVGMTFGNVLAGHLADWNVKRSIFIGFAGLIAALVAFALLSGSAVGLFITAFFVGGTSSIVVPSIQTRLMEVAGDAKVIAAALTHSTFNIGNSLGAFLGGAAIAAGFGYTAPSWLGIALALVGVVIATVSYAVQGRGDRRRGVPAGAGPHPATGPIRVS